MERYLLFFCCGEVECGWDSGTDRGILPEMAFAEFRHAVMLDLAERMKLGISVNVGLYERPACPIPLSTTDIEAIGTFVQTETKLRERIDNAVRGVFERVADAHVGIFLGSNPLYPLASLAKGFEWLEHEDDVVVLGRASTESSPNATSGRQSLMWYAVREFPADVFARADDTHEFPSAFSPTFGSDELVVSLKPEQSITSVRQFPKLMHDIEREMLLNKWYPRRTYELLKTMRKRGMIGSSPT